jgi:hypothetical protein
MKTPDFYTELKCLNPIVGERGPLDRGGNEVREHQDLAVLAFIDLASQYQ